MAINSQEIDLIIKAQLQGKNTLSDLAKSIDLVEKALDRQSQAAKRGEGSIESLQATLTELKIAQDRLKDQAQLIGQFQRLNDQIVKQQRVIEATKKSYDELNQKINIAGKSTEKQAEKLQKLTDATARQESTLNRQKTQYTELSSVLGKSGIDLNNLAKSENLARESAAKLGLAINKNQESIQTFTADVKRANEEKLFQNQLAEASKLVKAQEYVDFFTKALNEADAAKKKLATGNELNRIANDAVAAAKGFTTLNNAIQPKANISFKDTIQSIIDPAQQANKSLADLERQSDALSASTKNLSGPVKEYTNTLKELRAIQNSLVNTSSKIDSFSGQTTSLRTARAEFSKARAEVLKYAEAVRNSSERNVELETNLARAQTQLRAASTSLNEQVSSTRVLRDELRQAGINTGNLALSQQKLTSVARSTSESINRLNTSVKVNGQATETAAGKLNLFSNSGRTTLSFTQRFRGEILALTASYVGFFGIFQQGSSILEAYNKKLAIQSQLSLSVGNDTRAIADEYDYARGQADRLKLNFDSLATGYAKFLAAGSKSNIDKTGLRFIFESFAEVSKVAKLTKEDTDGVFIALSQILSKGKIQAEELRGQLGDRIFGAVVVAADALKDRFPDFDAALKKGLITSDSLIKIAASYKKIAEPALDGSLDSLISKQSDLYNSILDFKIAIAESGFADQFALLVQKLTKFLKSEDGTKFGKAVGEVFIALGKAAIFLVDHIKDVALILGVLFSGKILLGVGSFIVSFFNLGKSAIVLVGELGGIARVVRGLVLGFTGLGILLAALDLFKFLYDQFPAFKNFVDDTVALIGKLIGKTAEYLGLRDQATSGKFAKSDSLEGEEKRLARLKEIAEELLAIELERNKLRITGGTDFDREVEIKRKTRLDKRSNDLKTERDNLVSLAKKTPGATPEPNNTDKKPKGLTDDQIESAKKKYETLRSEVDSQLNALESKVSKKTADTLQEKLEAIKADYENLENKINKLGGKDRTKALGRLNSARDSLVSDAIDENNKKIIEKKQALEDSIAQIEGQAAKNEKLSLEARLKAIDDAQASKFAEITDFRKQLADANKPTAPADVLQEKRTNAVGRLKEDETRAFFLDEVGRREKAINDLISERTSRIQTLNEFQKAGLLTEFDTLQRSGAVVKELQPEIEKLTTEALAFASANRLAFTPEFVEAYIARITQAKFSYNGLRTELFTANSLATMLADGATKAVESVGTAIGNAAFGTGSWSDAVDSLRISFLTFAADFLREISLMIIKAELLQSLQKLGVTNGSGGFLGSVASVLNKSAGGAPGDSPINPIYTKDAALGLGSSVQSAIEDPTKGVIDNFFNSVKNGFNSLVNIGSSVFNAIGGFISKLFSSAGGSSGGDLFASLLGNIFHDGGLVGASGGRSRTISPLEFVGAPRYHSGGMPGLAPDEYASILQKNEEVLSADNPRNILNRGSNAGGNSAVAQPTNVKIMNFIDSSSVLSEALSTQGGTKAIVNFIRANKTQVKGALG